MDRSVQMVILRDNDNAFTLEDVSRTVHTLIGGKPGVIHEDILRRNALGNGVVLHGVDFIIVFTSMIAAHEQLGCEPLLIGSNRHIQSVLQHVAGLTIAAYAAAQHQDTVAGQLICFIQ